MSELIHQPCPFSECRSSDAFSYSTDKKVGYCHSCGNHYPSKLELVDWARDRYPTKDNYRGKEMVSHDTEEFRELRGITDRTMKFYNCLTQLDNGNPVSQKYTYPSGKSKYRMLQQKAFTTDPGFPSNEFYGMNLFNGGSAKSVTITEGELDAMSAFQMLGSKVPVVSLPSATPKRNILEHCKAWLDSFDKIYLSIDTDEKAEGFATNLMRLYPGKVYKVHHDKYKDANEFLQAGSAISYVNAWNNARLYAPQNILNSTEGYLDLYDHTPDHNYIPTNIPELDDKILGLMQGQFTVMLAETGVGKSLAPNTPVIKFDGTIVKAIDVNVGDKLMGPDSTPRLVTNVNVQHGDMYKITPIKGEPWFCNADHILSLKNTTTKKVTNVTLSDYITWGKTKKHLHKLYRVGIDFNVYSGVGYGESLAYCVGAYLCDGRIQGPEICMGKPKQPVIDYMLETYLNPTRIKFDRGVYYIGFSKKSVLWSEVSKALAGGKHIPDLIKLNKREDRLAILAGLLDTDGSTSNGCVEITQKTEKLADDICFVARSLGLAAYKKTKVVNSTNYYRVTISGDLSVIPTKRLKLHKRLINKDVLNTGFSVDYVGVGDYRGIALDGNHLFLLGDFTVTHNTELMRRLEYNFIKNYPDICFATWHLEETKLRSLLGLVSYDLNDNLTRRDLILDKGKDQAVRDSIARLTASGNYIQFSLGESAEIGDLVDEIRVLSQVYGCKYVFFEPIQDVLSISDEKEKESKLASLSIQLSKMAADLGIGIVTIAHTNENGDPKYCKMVRQRAGVVIELHRDLDADSEVDKNTLKLYVTKNRPCSTVGKGGELVFNLDTFTLNDKSVGF